MAMTSASLRSRCSTPRMSGVVALLVLVLCATARGAVDAARSSVSVGDPDAAHLRDWRILISAATGSGSGAAACPNATTVAVAASSATSASSVQITSSADCKSAVVKSAVVDKLVVLDVHSRGIAIVQSVPTDIQTLKLSNNSIASLANVAFSSALLTLDISSNALTSVADVSFPSSLTHLNVSRNPIASLKTLKLPSSLTHLDLTRLKLTTLEQVAFPDSLTALNLSGNAITRIAGVAFPKALTQFSLRTLLSASSSDSVAVSQDAVLNEFEVRQTDADLFAKFRAASFDVPMTARAACSDTRAKRLYVHGTRLCVLTNEVFAAKYSSSSASDSSAAATPAPQRPALDETIDQRRSWFLIGSVVGLGGFVACVFVVALCRASGRRLAGRSARREQLHKDQPLLAHHQRQSSIGAFAAAADDDDDDDDRNWQQPRRLGRASTLSSDNRSFATANESPVGAVTHV